VTRRNTIRYVAEVGSGVHSGAPKDEVEKLISDIRKAATYRLANHSFSLNFNPFNTSPLPIVGQFQYQLDAIDPVLAEVMAAAHYLVQSPEVQELESVVHQELSTRR
ncbi:MAG: hypothetical protein ACXWKP_00510, partial [Bradyrhizobium sp.]